MHLFRNLAMLYSSTILPMIMFVNGVIKTKIVARTENSIDRKRKSILWRLNTSIKDITDHDRKIGARQTPIRDVVT